MIGASKRHLGDVGESYFQHMRFAARVGGVAIVGGLACLVHAIIPGVCPSTGSSAIRRLGQMIDDRQNAR